MAPVTLFISFLLTSFVVLHSAQEDRNYTRCEPYLCNDQIGNLSFPFKYKEQSPECGLYSVDCSEGPPKIQLKERGYWHEITSISNNTISYVSVIVSEELRERLESNLCDDESIGNLSLTSPSPAFKVSITHDQTLLKCCNPLNTTYKDLKFGCSSHYYYYISSNSVPGPWLRSQCSVVRLPLLTGWNLSKPSSNFAPEFSLQLTVSKECYESIATGGICQVHEEETETTCLPAPSPPTVQHVEGGKSKLKLGLGIGLGGPTLLAACFFIPWCYRQKCASKNLVLSRNTPNLEAILSNYGLLQVKRYSYFDVKKMTNSFEEKLGQGGYGGVYKGKLKDGPLVAVKVLNRSKGNGEDFMNEVAAISRTSHVNIVSLLGFCFEGSKRALIYEFMPNGSLEKFIYDANNQQKDHHLGWEALEQISLGIARGLEYLHRGCNTRILHFDIKPHNILLDENFLPKISDFGLAKICDRKESIVSMLYARGTAGYIAPEVFCRSFGGVSHKSDVYSYRMMLSEMAGGRRNINVEAENTSEIYFPHWIYKRLELDEELGLHGIKSEEDKAGARKLIIVSLWCIQTDPSNRPAMKEVIEMLEGSVESLKIPPKPYLSSPAKSPAVADSSSTLVLIQ